MTPPSGQLHPPVQWYTLQPLFIQIGIANKYGYQAACRLITRIGDLRTRLGQTDKQQAGKHRAYVDDLLRRHAAKRSFVALLHTAIAKPKTTVIYDSRAR